MGDIIRTIRPDLANRAIEVVIRVHSEVHSANMRHAVEIIEEALRRLADIRTCQLSFKIVEITRSGSDPQALPHQLLIYLRNRSPSGGGATSPSAQGEPGIWDGMRADVDWSDQEHWIEVAMHEICHTVGIEHSTITYLTFPPTNLPLMQWCGLGVTEAPAPDDIAMLSVAYPSSRHNPSESTGKIRGRLVVKNAGWPNRRIPISGVSVIALDPHKVPIVSRLSGPRYYYSDGCPYNFEDQEEGEFILYGLPPGDYRLMCLDGHSYAGFLRGISRPPDVSFQDFSHPFMRAGFQADNLSTSGEEATASVTVGNTCDVGDIEIRIEPITLHGFFLGEGEEMWNSELGGGIREEIPYQEIAQYRLPDASKDTKYSIWIHVLGGLRDITCACSNLPDGLQAEIVGDPRGVLSGIHGAHYIHMYGVPRRGGHHTVQIQLEDAMGEMRTFYLNLSVKPYPTFGIVAQYEFEGDPFDSSGNNHDAHYIGNGEYSEDRDGNEPGALEFRGMNFLGVDHHPDFNLPEFTFVIFLKLPPARSDGWILSKGTDYGNFSLLRRGPDGRYPGCATLFYQTPAGNFSTTLSTIPLPVDSFFCLAVSRSDTSIRWYLDGQLIQTVHNPPPPAYNDAPVRIGAGGIEGVEGTLVGTLDDLRIYRSALSDQDVSNVYHGRPIRNRLLVSVWRLIEFVREVFHR